MALFIIVCLMLAFIIWGDQGVYQREKLRYLESSLRQSETRLKNDIEALRREKELLKDSRILESTIRKELGFIRQNEIIYQLKTKEEAAEKSTQEPPVNK